ncbi:MAG: tetratricopeptide repeat protein [Mycobacteriales bacterium]
MKWPWSLPATLLSVGALAAAGTMTSVVVRETGSHADAPKRAATTATSSAAPSTPSTAAGADPLAADIVKQQAEVRRTPGNYVAWASLGLDYVQQAKITVDPSYYPKATGVLARSLKINTAGNYVAMAGMAALKAAEHDFTAARRWALRGLTINPYNATLYGSLNDADTQLGRYQEALTAAQKMNRLQPGVPAFTRAEYTFELRGDLPNAKRALSRALAIATAPADKAFVYYYLGELDFNNGDPRGSLTQCDTGLRADPTYAALRQCKARAEAALGRTRAAISDYTRTVNDVPQPQYVVEFGEYLQSLGRTAQAQQQYQLFATENKLFEANGVTLDTDPTLFYANHNNPKLALHFGKIGLTIRPFIEMQDAYAWALHANGRNAEALVQVKRAMQLGTRNALFYYHAGMIEKALGNRTKAKADLRQALAINPYFSPLYAPVARASLAKL